MTPIERIKQAAEILKPLAEKGGIELTVRESGSVEVKCYHPGAYAEAIEWFRLFGIKDKSKYLNPQYNFTTLSGEFDGISFECYPNGLPPTCRKEEYVERIPKTQTVETGEFVDIKRTRIVCGDEVTKEE